MDFERGNGIVHAAQTAGSGENKNLCLAEDRSHHRHLTAAPRHGQSQGVPVALKT
jgi:hypothetical protein